MLRPHDRGADRRALLALLCASLVTTTLVTRVRDLSPGVALLAQGPAYLILALRRLLRAGGNRPDPEADAGNPPRRAEGRGGVGVVPG